MAASSSSISFSVQQIRKPFPIERRPRMLKDFLNENPHSCSSSGFKSFPRKPLDSKNSNPKVSKNQIKFSALQAVMNAVKSISFTAVKSPSFLPRSLSRKLSRNVSRTRSRKEKKQVKTGVKVKDILRWTSFRDLVEEISPPLDFSSSPHHYTITTTTTTTTTTDSSNGSSWSDSDFTVEFSPSYWSGSFSEKEQLGKKDLPCVGVGFMEATIERKSNEIEPQEEELLLSEEDEQQSPVSVLSFDQFREDEEPFSTFDQSFANVERTTQKLMQKIKRFENLANLEPFNLEKWMSTESNMDFEEEEEDEEEEQENGVEEKAKEWLAYVKATTLENICKANEDQLLFDFFRDELRALKTQCGFDEHKWENVRIAKAWMSGENKPLEWEVDHKREAYIRDMDKFGRWSKFEDEKEELAVEIENGIFGYLVDELLVDLFSK